MREGNDGRQYFDFCKNAIYQFYEREKGQRGNSTFQVQISECNLNEAEQEEYELVKIEKDAIPFKRLGTDELLEFLDAGFAEELDKGEEVQTPVTAAEAKWYYSSLRKQRRESRSAADKKLIGEQEKDSKGKVKLDKNGNEIWNGGNAEYRNLLKEQDRLERKISKSISEGKECDQELEEYRKVCTRRKELIEKSGIRIELYLPEKICPMCKNKGVDEQGKVCICAIQQSEKILSFCARERLRKRFSEIWVNNAELEEESEANVEEEDLDEVEE